MKELLEIMALLRDRERGCPWDVEQTFATIAPYTIEEAYEVADAVERGDLKALEEELGERTVGFRIDDEDLEDLRTVRDAVDYVYAKLEQG